MPIVGCNYRYLNLRIQLEERLETTTLHSKNGKELVSDGIVEETLQHKCAYIIKARVI